MKLFLAFLCLLSVATTEAQTQTPQPSPGASVSSVVGITDVRIDYFRPRVKGRKIFGEGGSFLVPYGKIWRTGANSGSKITFSDDVKVQGVAIPKGEYLIFTWPGAAKWTVSIYKDVKLGGNTAEYEASKEAAKFTVKPIKLAKKTEMLTFSINDISEDNTSGTVQLAWENTAVEFTVSAEYDAKVMKAIEEGTKSNPSNLISAARYYLDAKKDLKQALKWTNEYLSVGKNGEQFWHLNFKAKLLQAMGDKAGALAAAKQSLELAKKATSDYGYIKLNEDLIKSLK